MIVRQRTFHFSVIIAISMSVLLSLSGCATICLAAYTKYPVDTPEHLVDSYLRAYNRSYDEAIYYFSTSLAEQNPADRDAYITARAETCRWVAQSWKVDSVEFQDEGVRAVVHVSAVVASESEVTDSVLRFECMREGKRWLVLKREWVNGAVQ